MVTTMPSSEITDTSVVPPPISHTILPAGSVIGIFAPMAAASDSSSTSTLPAPAFKALSCTALLSTSVIQLGIPITMRGLMSRWRGRILEIKYRIIFSVVSLSAITPSFSGLIAIILPGVLHSIRLASAPTATTDFVPRSTATTEGSLTTIPFPFI